MLIQRGKRIFPGSTLSTLVQIVSRKYSKEVPENLKVPLSIAAYQIWGANTDVGKTLVSAGLMKEAVKNSQVPISNRFDPSLFFDQDTSNCDYTLTHECHFKTVGNLVTMLEP